MQSEPFTFLLGDANKPASVHKAAIAACSRLVDILVNGHMEEAQADSVGLYTITLRSYVFAYIVHIV